MKSLLHKLRCLRRRAGKEAELREELQFHLEQDAEQRQANGMAEREARWAARRELGNVALVEETTRGAWSWIRLEQFARDAGYGLRQVRRNPLFSGIAIATLALGIGGVTAMFSAFDAVLIRPMPYAHADRLVMIWDYMAKSDVTTRHNPTPAEWIEWRRLNSVFTDLANSQPGDATLSGEGEPEQVPARKVTWNFWSVLGAQPAIGRVFTEDEDNKGVRVVVISSNTFFFFFLLSLEAGAPGGGAAWPWSCVRDGAGADQKRGSREAPPELDGGRKAGWAPVLLVGGGSSAFRESEC